MLFFDARRPARAVSYALPAAGAVSAPVPLRQRALPKLLDPPSFRPRTRPVASEVPLWERLRTQLTRQVLLAAAIAGFVLALASSLPAWAALRGGSESVAPSYTVHSSAAVTGSAATRVEDLGVGTFVGQVPFVQQGRYLAAVAGTSSAPERFVEQARQASVAEYVQGVGAQITLPYLSDAVATRQAAVAWAEAVEQVQREQAVAAAVSGRTAWQAPPLTAGTTIHGANVTFYSCIDNGFCGNMATGIPAYEGAAACSTNLAFGTRFTIVNDPTGRVFTCLDRGALSATWVDIWFYSAADGWAWQSYVGTISDIVILN